MANNRPRGGCCNFVSGIISLAVIIVLLVAAFFISKYITIEQVGLADKPGILSRFNDSYAYEDTFRSQGMENWKVYDVLMWIIKSGEYAPA